MASGTPTYYFTMSPKDSSMPLTLRRLAEAKGMPPEEIQELFDDRNERVRLALVSANPAHAAETFYKLRSLFYNYNPALALSRPMYPPRETLTQPHARVCVPAVAEGQKGFRELGRACPRTSVFYTMLDARATWCL